MEGDYFMNAWVELSPLFKPLFKETSNNKKKIDLWPSPPYKEEAIWPCHWSGEWALDHLWFHLGLSGPWIIYSIYNLPTQCVL